MRKFFRRPHKYKSGNVLIKSDISLETAEVAFVIDTINKVMEEGYYEPCYHISRKIYHQFSSRISLVESYFTSRKLVVDILK